MNHVLSDGWKWVRLDECCDVVSGATPRTDRSEYWGGDILWATPRDLSTLEGTTLRNTAKTITEHGYNSCSTELLPAGAVLFTSRAPVGLVAIAGVPVCTNQGFKSLVPRADVDSRYLLWCLRRFARAIEHRGAGTTFTEVSKEVVGRFEIPVPALHEQRRIAKALDKADAVRRKRRDSLVLVDEVVRSVFSSMFGDPKRNERKWDSDRLGNLAAIRRGASPRPIDRFMGGTVPWIKIGDATNSSRLYIEHTAEQVTEAGAAKSVLLEPGSIIVANSGVSLGFARILKISGCIHDGWLSVEGLDSRVEKVFFVSFVNAITTSLRAQAPKGTQPNLNTEIMRGLRVPIPPLSLQRQFIEIIERLANTSDRIREALQACDDLCASLGTAAFGMAAIPSSSGSQSTPTRSALDDKP